MEQIRIDLVPGGVTPNAHATQYDVGRAIRFLLYNGGNSYTLAGTETITVDVTKPDGSTDTVSVTNTSSNYVDFVTTDGLLNQAGLYPCEISIVDGGTEIGSQNFNLRAEADAYDGADIVTATVGPADICTFTTTLAEPLQSVIVDIEATGGNGTPDNPNPINGYTEANITRCGVNLWELSDDTKNDSQACTYNYENNGVKVTASNQYARVSYVYKVKVAQPYTISFYGSGTANFLNVYYGNSTSWGDSYGRSVLNSTRTKYTKTITPTTDTLFIGFYATNTGTTGDMVIEDFMLEIGSTASDTFTPYNGNTFTIAFGQTVYGGVLDVTRGKLKPCIEYPSYNGETLSGRWLSSEATYVEGTTPPTGSQVVSLDDYDTDIDLTPEVISAIVTNNVFADCGETTVKYLKAGD